MARAVHPCADLWYKNAAMDLVQTLSTVVSLVGLVVVILAALWWRPRALVFQEGLCNACGYTIAETDTDRCSECGSPLAVQRAAVEQRVRARLVCGLIAIASCCVQMVVVPRLDKERWVPQVFRWEMGGSILLLPVRFVGSNGGWRSRGESDNLFDDRPARIDFTATRVALTIERKGERWFRVPDGEPMTAEDVGTALRVTNPAFPALVESLLRDEWKMKSEYSGAEIAIKATTPTIMFDSHGEGYPFQPLIPCAGSFLISGAALIAILVVRRRASA